MTTYQLVATTQTPSEAASLATWLGRQSHETSFVVDRESMGASEVIGATIGSSAALKVFLEITREWIRAHRTTIEVEIDGRGRISVSGTTDINQLIDLLADKALEDE